MADEKKKFCWKLTGCVFLYLVAGIFATPVVCPFVGTANLWLAWSLASIIGGIAAAALSETDHEHRPWLKKVTLSFFTFPVGIILGSIAILIVLLFVPVGWIEIPILGLIPIVLTIGILLGTGGSIKGFWHEANHGQIYCPRKVEAELAAIGRWKPADRRPEDEAVIDAILAREAAEAHGHGGHH